MWDYRTTPILIVEKMGPHFAIGDTCYSRAEDHAVFNPDGKEIIARENEISARRNEEGYQAYFNCHTDITIPYDEIEEILVVDKDENMFPSCGTAVSFGGNGGLKHTA